MVGEMRFLNSTQSSPCLEPQILLLVQELIGEGDEVAVAWLWTGTHDGDMPGFPATGNVVSMSGLTIYYFEGDRVSGHWQVTDRLGVFQQLSAGVKPGE